MMESRTVMRFSRELSAAAKAADDAEGLEQLWGLLKHARSLYLAAGHKLTQEGFSLQELATAAGVSKQAMSKRLAPRGVAVDGPRNGPTGV